MEEPGGQPENRIKAPKKAETQTIFQKQQQEIRQLKQQLAALKSDHARSAGQSSLDGLKNGLGQMLFKVTGNAGRNSAGKRSEAMRQWDATATAKKERSGDMQKILAVPKKCRDKQMTTGKNRRKS